MSFREYLIKTLKLILGTVEKTKNHEFPSDTKSNSNEKMAYQNDGAWKKPEDSYWGIG